MIKMHELKTGDTVLTNSGTFIIKDVKNYLDSLNPIPAPYHITFLDPDNNILGSNGIYGFWYDKNGNTKFYQNNHYDIIKLIT